MKYTLFIYFYNHILDLIIYVSNSLAASTWSYGTWFLKKNVLLTKDPTVALRDEILCEKMRECFFLE